MSEHHVEWAGRQTCGGPAPKLTLMILAALADDAGMVAISVRDLRWYTHCGERTQPAALNELARLGLITPTRGGYRVNKGVASPLTAGDRVKLHVTPDLREAVFERDGRFCARCGDVDALEIDHIQPRALGGCHVLENLQVLCGPCNREKGTGE